MANCNEYGPFGEVIRQTGPMAKANPIRFSTKYQDDESDLLYYGYRYYKPSTGTWPNRDPLGDALFLRAQSIGKTEDVQQRLRNEAKLPSYLFVRNAPIDYFDFYGLQTLSVGKCQVIVFYGHGSTTPYQWDFGGTCSAGIFIGCYDASTDGGVGKQNSIPGVQTTDDTIDMSDLDKYFDPAWTGALAKAKSLCKQGCGCICPSITVTAQMVKTGDVTDLLVPDEHAKHPDVTVSCK